MVYVLAIYQNIRNIIGSPPNRPRRTRNLKNLDLPKSQLTVPVLALVPVDTDEYRQIRPYRNHRLADCSYRRNQ